MVPSQVVSQEGNTPAPGPDETHERVDELHRQRLDCCLHADQPDLTGCSSVFPAVGHPPSVDDEVDQKDNEDDYEGPEQVL